MAEIFDYKAPFSLKNFLGSKGAAGLESIFNYVPDRMKISILEAMHKMHPAQAENFMMNLYNEWVNKLGTIDESGKVYGGGDFHHWAANKIKHRLDLGNTSLTSDWPSLHEGPWGGQYGGETGTSGHTNIYKVPYDHIKKLRARLLDPNLDEGTKKIINQMLEQALYDATEAGKYNKLLMDQLEKSGVKTITSMSPEGVDMGKSILIDDTPKGGEVIDFKTRKPMKIINPHDAYLRKQFPDHFSELRKPIPAGQNMAQASRVAPKGIPWTKYGMKILRHPITRGVGVAADAVVGGMALSDVIFGTSSVGNSMRDLNEMMGVPYKDDGTVQTSIPAYRDQRSRLGLPRKTSQPYRGFTQTDYGKAFNRGGLASFVL